MRLDRYRLRALARPARRWALALALASLTFVLVRGAVGTAEAARARWGTTRAVWVTRAALAPGDPVGAALDRRELPTALVPADALDGDAPPPAGARVAMGLLAGDTVRAGHLGSQARAGDGRRVVALPRAPGLALAAGDRVDVADVTGNVVAAGAVIVAVADETVEAAVAGEELGAVARALADGRLVLALAG